MKIYPKISKQAMCDEMNEIIRTSDGVEIQFFDEKDKTSEFNFWDTVKKIKEEFPNLREITVHPPLEDYNFEMLILKDKRIVEKQLDKMVELSRELDMNLNFLYHVYMTKDQYISTGLMNTLKDMVERLEDTRVTVLLENLYMMISERKGCSAVEICQYIDHPNLRVCIDTTHMHCKANIYKYDFNEMVENDFDRETCEKYVKQVHFAATLNNDGYINKKTHGRRHENEETLAQELDWLRKYGMGDKNYITEVSEENYYTRVDQIAEINMLKKCIIAKS